MNEKWQLMTQIMGTFEQAEAAGDFNACAYCIERAAELLQEHERPPILEAAKHYRQFAANSAKADRLLKEVEELHQENVRIRAAVEVNTVSLKFAIHRMMKEK